jgi:hypothetical protein
MKVDIRKSGISPFNRIAITPGAGVPYRVSAYQNENSQEDDPILHIQYMQHSQSPHCVPIVNHESDSSCCYCTVAHNTISSAVNSGDPGNKNFDKARENSEDNCTCSVCRLDCTYYFKKSTGAKWIHCCFSLL